MADGFRTEINPFAQSFPWNTKRERASALVAGGKRTNTEIANELKISPSTIKKWKKRRDFQVRVERHQEIWRNRVLQTGIADRTRRIEALNERWDKMRQVIVERGASPDMQSVPGGSTGLLVKQTKLAVYTGEFIDNFLFDCNLLRELRAHEKQAAQELGQWIEKKSVDFKDCSWVELAREVVANGGELELTATTNRPRRP